MYYVLCNLRLMSPYLCVGMHADTEQATPNRPPAAVAAAALAAVGVAVLNVGVTRPGEEGEE
jgi:hypothetical protein